MISLIIKGDRFTASRAVTERGIVVYARPSVPCLTDCIRIDAVDSELQKIVDWFCEGSMDDCVPGRGFPDGTLLLYSCHESEVTA